MIRQGDVRTPGAPREHRVIEPVHVQFTRPRWSVHAPKAFTESMISRVLTTVILLSTGLAHADGGQTELVPSCADVDAQRDTLTPELRTRAVQQLTRVLEREQLLVVTTGCVDRYVVSHEAVGDTLVVRVAGPHGIRKMRNGSLDRLGTMYARMVESLLAPPPPVPQPQTAPDAEASTRDAADPAPERERAEVETAAVDPYAAPDPYPDIDAVAPDEIQIAPDRILYGQLIAGSVGGGWGIGYRRHAGEHLALDVSLGSTSDFMRSSIALGLEALYVPRPRYSMTPYVGGGMSLAADQEDSMTGGGLRAELTAGVSFARAGTFRWFTQVDAAMPLYTLQDYNGGTTYRPSISFSLGLGF